MNVVVDNNGISQEASKILTLFIARSIVKYHMNLTDLIFTQMRGCRNNDTYYTHEKQTIFFNYMHIIIF